MKKSIAFAVFLLFSMFLIQSCNTNKVETKKQVERYIGKEIQMPIDSIIILENDSVISWERQNLLSNNIKLVTRIDGQCHICVHELDQWKQELLKRFKNHNVQFVFYLYTDNYDYFKNRLYYRISGTYPILIDTTNAFVRDNNLPEGDKRFHTFLLNENNKVILVGNSIMNSQIKD